VWPADDDFVISFQNFLDSPGSKVGAFGVNLIYQIHDINIFMADWNRLVVETGSGNIQKLGLTGNGDIGVASLYEFYSVTVI
jgi:hypothetical protein